MLTFTGHPSINETSLRAAMLCCSVFHRKWDILSFPSSNRDFDWPTAQSIAGALTMLAVVVQLEEISELLDCDNPYMLVTLI